MRQRRQADTRAHRTGSAAPVELVPEPVYIDGGKAEPASGDEIEPNDGVDTATPLALGGTVRGRIEPDGDVDHYRIDVTSAGALAVMVSAVDGVDLTLEIEDASGETCSRTATAAARAWSRACRTSASCPAATPRWYARPSR